MSKCKWSLIWMSIAVLSGCKSTNASFENLSQLEQLATQAYVSGDLHLAEGYWLDITRIMPEHNDGWCQLGYIDYRLHRYAAAGNAFKKCLAIRPHNLAGWHNLTAVKLREASETLIRGSAYLQGDDNQQLVQKYQLLMRELLRLHGIADGAIGEANKHEG